MIAHALAVIGNTYLGKELNTDRAAVLGMYHDATEIITGDMPTPIKYYNPEIRHTYKEIEQKAGQTLLSMLPEEMGKVYRPILFYEQEDVKYYPIVKAADKLSAYIKCVEEVKAGNREFVKAMESTLEALQALELPEVSHFMSHYIEAYNKTLDEMN